MGTKSQTQVDDLLRSKSEADLQRLRDVMERVAESDLYCIPRSIKVISLQMKTCVGVRGRAKPAIKLSSKRQSIRRLKRGV